MIGGDELSVVLAIIGLGASLVLAGLSQSGWRGKWLIRSLFGLGTATLLAALTWPLWKGISPSVSATITILSNSPITWFAIITFLSASFLFTYKTKSALDGYMARLSPEQKASAASRPAWKQELVLDGHINGPPHMRFVFAENGRNARLYVDFSVFYPAIYNADWTEPVRLEVKRFDHFARDQSVRLDLFEQVGGADSYFWRFRHIIETDDSKNPRHLLSPSSSCRGRFTLLTEDNREFHCYFMAEVGNGLSGPPHVLGQHMFDHAWKWEKES